jgi:hypothetical protein
MPTLDRIERETTSHHMRDLTSSTGTDTSFLAAQPVSIGCVAEWRDERTKPEFD